MTPEDEEFMEADSILQNAPIPRIPLDAPLDRIQNLVATCSSCVFYHGDLLSAIESIKIPLTSISLFIQSYGISSFEMGSGRGVWDGSIIFGSWLCSTFKSNSSTLITSAEPVKILELGSGCSGVPGLCVARVYPNASVVLSDAHATLIRGLEQNLLLNGFGEAAANPYTSVEATRISAQVLNWNHHEQPTFGIKWNNSLNSNEEECTKADIIIGAELLWAGCDPEALLQTICKLLDTDHGVAYILMPKGGRGVEVEFLNMAAQFGFQIETVALGPFESWDGRTAMMPPLAENAQLSQLDMNINAEEGTEFFQVHILKFNI